MRADDILDRQITIRVTSKMAKEFGRQTTLHRDTQGAVLRAAIRAYINKRSKS